MIIVVGGRWKFSRIFYNVIAVSLSTSRRHCLLSSVATKCYCIQSINLLCRHNIIKQDFKQAFLLLADVPEDPSLRCIPGRLMVGHTGLSCLSSTTNRLRHTNLIISVTS